MKSNSYIKFWSLLLYIPTSEIRISYIQNHFIMNVFVTCFFSFFRMLVCKLVDRMIALNHVILIEL